MYVVYCHVGKIFPDHLFQSLYQTLLWHQNKDIQVYVILDREYIESFRKGVSGLAISADLANRVFVVPSESLSSESLTVFLQNAQRMGEERKHFRGNFWISTTSRFFYIDALVHQFRLQNVFHVENDVLMYASANDILASLSAKRMTDKIVAVQDAPSRAVCSLVYIPNSHSIRDFTDWIITSTTANPHQNDMELMGTYRNKYHFPDSPTHPDADAFGVYDGACIGQFLGGTDFKNINPAAVRNRWINPTVGFINETATFKPNTAMFAKTIDPTTGLKKYIIRSKESTEAPIRDLVVNHVHSKHLHLFSSVFDIGFDDLITGDTILRLCDLVFIDTPQLHFNRHLAHHKSMDDVVHIQDFNNINVGALREIIMDRVAQRHADKPVLRLFVFIDIMHGFVEHVLPHLPDECQYIIYSHNGDYAFTQRFASLLESPKIVKVFAQNIDHPPHDKLVMLPIGMARTMWPHGDLDALYETMATTYYKRKTGGLYVNINPVTYPSLRKPVLDAVKHNGTYNVVESQDYKTYLKTLSSHRFSLCVRGNGIDTHRFWESLYLGVIPVVVDDGTTDHFLKALDVQRVPYVKISNVSFFDKMGDDFFNKDLYDSILRRSGVGRRGIQTCDFLKLGHYV
jgi:hypothetical protein